MKPHSHLRQPVDASLNYGGCDALFQVPGLRNVAVTAPYMHNGTLAGLRDVVRHYSAICDEKLALAVPSPHADPTDLNAQVPRVSVLKTLHLGEAQISDLFAFLETLTEKSPKERLPVPGFADCK
jgi:cytochrome c peroxidase